MERKELIKKWLDDELNSQELEAFKKLRYKILTHLKKNPKLIGYVQY